MIFLQTYGDIGMCVNYLLCVCCIGVLVEYGTWIQFGSMSYTVFDLISGLFAYVILAQQNRPN